MIEGGDLYSPEPAGEKSLLVANEHIETIDGVDVRAVEKLGVDYEVIDASGCYVVPGFVDPHAHLLGGSGEGSLALQTPMMFVEEIAGSGVTTVVGTLGVDTTMKTMSGLLARVKALGELGITARCWTGGYNVPPTTVIGSVRQDMMFIDEIIGAGEIAISDERGLNQSGQELAKVVRDTHVGGLLTGKSGLTHFHVGEEDTRLAPLTELVEEYQCKCEWLYPTHIQRSEKLLRDAIALALEGAHVDMDVVEQDLDRWLKLYIDNGGPLDKLTISSDMDSSTPEIYYRQFCELIVKHGYTLDLVLPLFTANPARTLKLKNKGCLRPGADADVVVLEKGTLDVRTVIARGRVMKRDGTVVAREKWLEKSQRRIDMIGDEHPSLKGD